MEFLQEEKGFSDREEEEEENMRETSTLTFLSSCSSSASSKSKTFLPHHHQNLWLGKSEYHVQEDAVARSYDQALAPAEAINFNSKLPLTELSLGNDNYDEAAEATAGGGGGGGVGVGVGVSTHHESIEKEHMFDKVLTPSDVGKLNRLAIPKQHAEKHFPLDCTNEKGLLLNFEDRNGKPWWFRYSYWNSSQCYVMTKGWSRFLKEKKLVAGDIVSFEQGVGESGKDRLYIDWRRRPDAPNLTNYPHFDRSLPWPSRLYSTPQLSSVFRHSFWMPTSVDTEMPESSPPLLLPLEWKKRTGAKPAKELNLMESKADEGIDKESQACKEQELDNPVYDKNDFDTVIAHYTKLMELGDGDISCLINRAIAYLVTGQYEECINDCDKAVERGRQLKSDSKMIEIALTTKGIAFVKKAKLSKDFVPTIETYQKAPLEHLNPETLKKLINDAEEAKRELEQQKYFDTKLADEEHEKEADNMTGSSEQKKFEIEEIGNKASQTRQTEGMQVREMQMQALSTLQPQGVVFDVEAVKKLKIIKSSGQMELQIEDVQMDPEASEQHRLFLMQGGLGLTKLPKDEDWSNAKEIYLMDTELSTLPDNPRCPNLSALFLPRNYKLRTIPPSFFINMPALEILNLSRTSIKSLPDSFFSLVGLKRLFLNDCHRLMMLSPKVGNLKLLEVLDLEGAKIMDLPMVVKELINLTSLEVSFYGYTSNGRRAMQSNAMVPSGVISTLSQLEELNIDVNPDDERWDARVEDIVSEVCTLRRLETLKFYFPRVELLRHFQWNSPLLSHFRFTVGRHVKRIMSRVPSDVEFELERQDRCLKYINGVGVPRDIKNVLQQVTAFFLDRHATVKKLSDFGTRNMKQLKCCVVGECNEVQVIIDVAGSYGEDGVSEIISKSNDADRIVMGSLEYLYIYYMKSLRSIWEGPLQQNSLFHLKSLTLRTCPQLTTIFTQGLLANLCNLEEIKVEDCPSIKSIVSCKISAEHRTSYFLLNLKKISLHYMPGLISISSGLKIAPKLEWLSFYNCPNLKNPLIDEISSQDLKKIKGERSWWEALEWSSSCPSYLEEIFAPIDMST